LTLIDRDNRDAATTARAEQYKLLGDLAQALHQLDAI